jgi:hypothetical protein
MSIEKRSAFKIPKLAPSTERRKTFKEILQKEAPRSARRLEATARNASWLAKIHPEYSSELYAIKHAALRQLFRIPGQAPVILDAWSSASGFLLSVQLRRTRSLLHVPFEELRITPQQAHAAWVAQRARGRWWRPRTATNRSAFGSEAA